MKTNYELCTVTCNFPKSEIRVAFSPENTTRSFAMKFNKIRMPKTTAEQKALATWEVALMLRNAGMYTVNVYFETNDDVHRSTYRKTVLKTLNTVVNRNYHVASRSLDDDGMAFEILDVVEKFVYVPGMNKLAVNGICDDLYKNTYDDCTYYSHFRITDANTERLGGLKLPDVDVRISRITDYEIFAIISTLDDEPLTPTYRASSIAILISPYEVYYRREIEYSEFKYCYFDIDNRVPYIDFFRELSTNIRERCGESIITKEEYEQYYGETYKLQIDKEGK